MKLVTELKREDCCGCGACFNACPNDAVEMSADSEGFLYPQINDKCVNCGLCVNVCPAINAEKDAAFPQTSYMVQHKDAKILFESTSGGAFTAIAEYVIEQGGVVFGAAFDKDFNVIHIPVTKKADLKYFRNSKYVQSDTSQSFKRAAEYLKLGKLVLYSGTPCQTEGLHRYIKAAPCVAHNINLILVDVVCRAVPSSKVLHGYLKWRQDKREDIGALKFRDKRPYGYKYSQMSLYDRGGEQVYHNGIDSDVMLRAFFSNICDRPSCYCCKFKKRYRVSDFTIWDCFNPADKTLDNDKGVTNVLIHTKKAADIFNRIYALRKIETNPDDVCGTAREMTRSVPQNPKRAAFFLDLDSLDFDGVVKKYFPQTLKVRLHRLIRRMFVALGVYRPAVRLLKKSRGAKWRRLK